MKKYTLFLFVCVIIFSLFTININSVSALDSGCTTSGPYSTTTGQPCGTSTGVVCPTGDLFSSATGQPCTTWQDNSPSQEKVAALLDALFKRELAVGSRGDDVRALQQILKDAGFLSGKVDGVYGPITRNAVTGYQREHSISATGRVNADTVRKIKEIPVSRICPLVSNINGDTVEVCSPISIVPPEPCPLYMDASGNITHACPPYPIPPTPPPCYLSAVNGVSTRICPPTSIPPVISGVSGPQTLNINQQGTWTVTASSSDGGNLSYSVEWGDRLYALNSTASPEFRMPQQSATFTHNYLSAGIYKPVFTVTNISGGSAQSGLSVNVGNATSGSITVFSPNGGETWVKGTTQTISWQDLNNISTHEIKLVPFYPPCTSNICPAYPYHLPYIIANTQGNSYSWSVGRTMDNTIVPDGSYTIEVCQTGTAVCDSSDSYFKIVSGGTTTQVPMISSISPTSGPVGTTVTIYGTGFAGAYTLVNFGGYTVPTLSRENSDTQISFNVPSNLSNCAGQLFCTQVYIPVNPGAYLVAVSNSNGTSKGLTFTVSSILSNDFYITPSSSTIGVGQVITLQSVLNNCPIDAQCFVGPRFVSAIWSSSNPSVARITNVSDMIFSPCPSGGLCPSLSSYSAIVTGMSPGSSTITAVYQDSGGSGKAATASVTVR